MTTEETTRKTLIGVLKSVAEEEKGGKSVVTYQVMRDQMKFPDFITLWPAKDGTLTRPAVKLGQRYAWLCEAKPKQNGKGVYLDLLEATAPTSPPDEPEPEEAQARPAGSDLLGWEMLYSQERQEALQAAVHFTLGTAGHEKAFPTAENVLAVARVFLAFNSGKEAVPTKTPQAVSPTSAREPSPAPAATPAPQARPARAPDAATTFWNNTHALGYTDAKEVEAILGSTVPTWLLGSAGRTHAMALVVLKEAKVRPADAAFDKLGAKP